jgi:hypothetical protein
MPRAKRGLSLLVAALGMTALLLSQFGTIEAASGRDFPRCNKSCNETSKLCKSQCDVDCAALFPPGVEQDACIADCNGVCVSNAKECKGICHNIKDNPSPTEP